MTRYWSLAPQFDAQTFQTNSLRFSPYSHQSFLPSQPWPQTVKPTTNSSGSNPNVGASAPHVMSSSGAAPPQDGQPRQISAGPDDQLFDELNNALHAEEEDNAHDPSSQTPYLTGDNRITFDPRLQGDWNGMRQQQPYQPFIQNYPQISLDSSQPAFSSTLAHHPARNSAHSFLPNSTPNRGPSTFFHPRPPPPPPPPAPSQNNTRTKPSMPGYYKSSLKLWSQEEQNAPPPAPLPSSAQPTHNFASMNSPYPHLSYSATPTYPPPQPLASTPVNAFTNYASASTR